MVGIDLQVLFEDKVGSLMTNVNKAFKSTEEERFLNEAQDLYVDKLADVYELNESARRSLAKLTKSFTSSPITTPITMTPLSDNSVFIDIQTDIDGDPTLMRIVEEQAIDGSGNRIRIKPITHDQYLLNINNPYKQPYEDLVWRVDIDNLIELIPDATTTVASYEWRYIEAPIEIQFASAQELSLLDDDLYEIIDLAVGLALKSFSVGRV